MNVKFNHDLKPEVFPSKGKIAQQYSGLLEQIWPRVRPEKQNEFNNKRYRLHSALEVHAILLNKKIFNGRLVDQAQRRVDESVEALVKLIK